MIDWAQVLLPLTASLVAGVWAVHKWTDEREAVRRTERTRIAALYVNPFVLAAEDLQSRLFNILEKDGLTVLRTHYPDGDYAAETLYLIVQYFAWERCIFRYGPYSQDRRVIELTSRVRDSFAGSADGVGAFCFFRPEQRALGSATIKRTMGEFGPEFEGLPFFEFKQILGTSPISEIRSVDQTLHELRVADSADDLTGQKRLAMVQNHLVDVLEYIEAKEEFSVFPGGTRKKARLGKTGGHP